MNKRLNKEEKKELIRIFDKNGYDVINIETLSFELEEQGATYIGEKEDIIDQWTEVMDIKCPLIYLDEDKIIEDDNDWEELSNKRYLNTYRLFEEEDELKRLELNKKCIKMQ